MPGKRAILRPLLHMKLNYYRENQWDCQLWSLVAHAGFYNRHLLLGIMVYSFHWNCLSLSEGLGLWKEENTLPWSWKEFTFHCLNLGDFGNFISQERKRINNIALKLVLVASNHSLNKVSEACLILVVKGVWNSYSLAHECSINICWIQAIVSGQFMAYTHLTKKWV